MPYPNQIPRPAEIVGPGIDALGQTLPACAAWMRTTGRWADVAEGWSAQAALATGYLVDEVASARLAQAKKGAVTQSLTELCRSEFDTDRTSGAVAAVGSVTLSRANGPGGAIPKGFRFRRDAQPSAIPAVPAMIYVASRNVPVTLNQATVQVPVTASRAGADGNAPSFIGLGSFGTVVMADTPFDTSFSVSSYEAGGGLDAEDDLDLVAQAKAYAVGQYGPIVGAITAGALRGTGAHRAAVRDYAQILNAQGALLPCATTGLCLADASWGFGPTWLAQVTQAISDGFQGFGCSLLVTGAVNQLARVDCSVTLRDANSLNYTDDITVAIQQAVRAYFDDRPDWYVFRASGLRAAISRADRRILSCSSATVADIHTNATIVDTSIPAVPLFSSFSGGMICRHWYLVNDGVAVSYSAPS